LVFGWQSVKLNLITVSWIIIEICVARPVVGFALYFCYGMWNSSEEYVRKGKVPPGGTIPLPDKPTINAVASAAVTAR
jgi:hypothetical protein